jgi:phage shock protein PspC (stress-responsive transcriptional regulator)
MGFLVIFQSMYTAVLERTREIGILKSMGASKLTIVGVVLRETAAMAVAGVLLGIAGTYGVQRVRLLLARVSHQHFEITAPWLIAPGRGDRLRGSDVRRALSGVDGGAQRSPSTRWRTNRVGRENLKDGDRRMRGDLSRWGGCGRAESHRGPGSMWEQPAREARAHANLSGFFACC